MRVWRLPYCFSPSVAAEGADLTLQAGENGDILFNLNGDGVLPASELLALSKLNVSGQLANRIEDINL